MLEPALPPDVNLVIKMLRCNLLDKKTIALIGRYLTEQALFEVWLLADAWKATTPREAAGLLQVHHEQTRRVYQSWRELEIARQSNDPNGQLPSKVQSAINNLTEALETAVSTLANLRTSYQPG